MAQYVATMPKRTVKSCCCHGHESCSVCDVTCFERPRFFCGQLLTDVELTAEQTYEIDKHRLHNRMLHGAGVVCGLRVQCHPQCNGWVTISPGYAIDCCGNDIVVCEPTPFDVLDAIRKYETKKQGDGCIAPPPKPGRKKYCLALAYAETEAKPVTAFVRCNGGTSTRCEPSRTAETFRIEVLEPPATTQKVTTWVDRVLACYGRMAAAVDTLSKSESYASARTAAVTVAPAVSAIRDAVIAGYNTLRIRCALPKHVREMQWPALSSNSETYIAAAPATLAAAISSVVQFLIDCLCEALLIECPDCVDLRVIIACVDVEDSDILHICNTARRYVLTFPALGYWLAPLTVQLAEALSDGRNGHAHSIAELIEFLCCGLDLLTHGLHYHATDTPDEAVRNGGVQAAYHASLVRLAVEFVKAIPAVSSTITPMLGHILEPGVVPVVTIHNQTPDTATALLKERGYTVAGVRPASPAELPALLAHLARGVPPGDVELLTGPDGRVIGFVPRPPSAPTAAPPAPPGAPGAPPLGAAAAGEVEALKARVADLESRLAKIEPPGEGGPAASAPR